MPGALITAEEEQFVLDDAATGHAAELAALQGVAQRGRVLARVEIAIAQELEEIAVESVGSRLGYDIDHTARVQPVLGRQSVGLHAEFLHRVRERNRHVHVAEGVVIIAAVQQVVQAVGRPAGHRKLAGSVGAAHVLAARQVAPVQGHRAGGDSRDHQQVGQVTPIERQIHDPLRLDDLRYRRIPRLHHAGAGLHFHRLRQCAHLQRDVLREVLRHLQRDARL